MVNIYATDLAESKRTDAFMGEGFEKMLKQAEEQGEDLIIGTFLDNNERRIE